MENVNAAEINRLIEEVALNYFDDAIMYIKLFVKARAKYTVDQAKPLVIEAFNYALTARKNEIDKTFDDIYLKVILLDSLGTVHEKIINSIEADIIKFLDHEGVQIFDEI